MRPDQHHGRALRTWASLGDASAFDQFRFYVASLSWCFWRIDSRIAKEEEPTMKRVSLLLTAALLLCLPAPARAQRVDQSGDGASIRQVVQVYVDARESSSVEQMKKVLHPRARLFLEARGTELAAQTPSQLYAIFRSNARHVRSAPPMPEGRLKIERIDITDGIAAVKLEIDYPTSKITEQLSLLKFADGWKIVSRISIARPELTQAKLK